MYVRGEEKVREAEKARYVVYEINYRCGALPTGAVSGPFIQEAGGKFDSNPHRVGCPYIS